MKRALETLLLALALGLAGYVALRVQARRSGSGASAAPVMTREGRDVEDPRRSVSAVRPPQTVKEVPMIRVDHPPKSRARAQVPPPSPAGR